MSGNVRAYQNQTSDLPVAVRDASEADADAIVALAQALANFEEVGDSAFTKEHFLHHGFGDHASFKVIVAVQTLESRVQSSEFSGGEGVRVQSSRGEGAREISASAGVTNASAEEVSKIPSFSAMTSESKQNEKVIGFLMYYAGFDLATASHGSHLADVFVDEAARGHGAGRALIRELARRTLDSGGEWVSWTVLKKNRAAKKFYTGLGASNVNVDFMAWGASSLRKLAQ